MGAYVGPLGNLIEATQWQERQSVETGYKPSFFTALDGSRTAFVHPQAGRSLREWRLSMSDARPEEAAAIQALVLGAMGIGPFVFVDPLAQVTNVLTPQQSIFAPGTISSTLTSTTSDVPGIGPMPAVMTVANSWARVGDRVPVIPGQPVTASIWVRSTRTVKIQGVTYDANGSTIDTATGTARGTSSGGWISVTFTPSPRAAYMHVSFQSSGADAVACPAVTWTSERLEWAPGRGAKQVVVHGLDESFMWADHRRCGQRRVDYDIAVTEVGTGA